MSQRTFDNIVLRRIAFWFSVSLPVVPAIKGLLFRTFASSETSEDTFFRDLTLWLWIVMASVGIYYLNLLYTGFRNSRRQRVILPITLGAITIAVLLYAGWEAALTAALGL